MLIALLALLQAATVPNPAGEEPVAPYAQSDGNAGATPLKGAAVWRAFHESAGVGRIVDALIARNQADPRISDIFKGQDLVRLRRVLKEQLCYVLGGGCTYSGRSMADAHRNMGVQQADMAALVENLQASMREERVPFWAQNRLLAKLAPMHRNVVTR